MTQSLPVAQWALADVFICYGATTSHGAIRLVTYSYCNFPGVITLLGDDPAPPTSEQSGKSAIRKWALRSELSGSQSFEHLSLWLSRNPKMCTIVVPTGYGAMGYGDKEGRVSSGPRWLVL